MLHFMVLCPEDVSKIRVGTLSKYTYVSGHLGCATCDVWVWFAR